MKFESPPIPPYGPSSVVSTSIDRFLDCCNVRAETAIEPAQLSQDSQSYLGAIRRTQRLVCGRLRPNARPRALLRSSYDWIRPDVRLGKDVEVRELQTDHEGTEC
jgi:hypothetical protein